LKAKKKLMAFGLVAVLSLSIGVSNPTVGPLGVDVVSAATATPAPAPAPKPAPKPAPAPAPKPAPAPTKPATTPVKTTTNTANTSNTASTITRVLVKGSVGNDVKLLQTLLNENGFNLAVDGSFGPLTLSAVKSYQGKNGLVVDGFVGPKTNASLFAKKTTPVEPVTPVTPTEPVKPTEPAETVDVVSSASLPATVSEFEEGISKEGKWIITPLNNIVSEKELVVEGTFHSKNDTTKDIYRKIGFYTQDDAKNVTGEFTLTAPKLTVKSPNTRLQNGTYATDIYVEAEGFNLKGAKIKGNVYFANQAAKESFEMDETSSVTGVQELVEEVDVVSSASLPSTIADFEKGISKEGKWIITPLNDIVSEKELVVEGTFYNKDDVTSNIYRKIGFYTLVNVDGM
jgi:hypothetical protein